MKTKLAVEKTVAAYDAELAELEARAQTAAREVTASAARLNFLQEEAAADEDCDYSAEIAECTAAGTKAKEMEKHLRLAGAGMQRRRAAAFAAENAGRIKAERRALEVECRKYEAEGDHWDGIAAAFAEFVHNERKGAANLFRFNREILQLRDTLGPRGITDTFFRRVEWIVSGSADTDLARIPSVASVIRGATEMARRGFEERLAGVPADHPEEQQQTESEAAE